MHALDLAVGPAFVAAGLSTWARRPASRTGLLTAAFGLAWAARLLGPGAGLLDWPGSAVPLGRVLESLHAGVLVQVVATLPTGRASTWSRRAAVAAGYLLAVPAAAADLLWPQLLVWIAVLAGVVGGLRSGVLRRRAMQLVVPGAAVTAAGQLLVQLWPAAAAMLLAWPLALLLGLLRSRLDRSVVNDLVAELRSGTPGPGRLRDALAAALHDPTLELTRDPGGLPVAGAGRAVTPLDRDGRRVGALLHDAELTAEPDLLDAVAAGAAMALDNERLHAEIRGTLREVEDSRARIVRAADAARERVERDLHDGVQQRLDGVALLLRLAGTQLTGAQPAGTQPGGPTDGAVAGVLDEAGAELAAALAELRELARGIYPVLLTDAGLAPALASLAERAPVPTVLGPVVQQRLPESVEQAGYFVVAELLDHAGRLDGVSQVRVEAVLHERELRLVVAHDGRDPEPVAGLVDRVGALDGELRVRTADGEGTTVVATVPLDAPPD